MDWRLTDVAKDELAELEADGVPFTPQDVLTVQYLSCDLLRRTGGAETLSRGAPVEVGGVVLWPFTLAGAAFYREMTNGERNELRALRACAYAMAHGGDDCIYARGDEAEKAMDAWWWRIRATREAIAEAVAECLELSPRVEDPMAEDRDRTSLALFAAALVGGSPEMWERQCSIASVRRIVDLAQRVRSVGAPPSKDASRIEAVRRLGLYVESIRARARGGDNGQRRD